MGIDVRWMRYQGTRDQAEVDRIIDTELYKLGDTILVWVNEGDILRHTNMDPTPEDIAADNKRLREVLEWLDDGGGLGHTRHERIQAALGKTKRCT